MVRLAQIWRRQTGGVLAALLLALVTLGPGLDAMLCAGDVAPDRHAETLLTSAGIDNQDHAGKGCDDAGGRCLHGHVHPGAPLAPSVQPVARARPLSERLAPPQTLSVASLDPPVLERPPRA